MTHTSTEQPEALRLVEWIESDMSCDGDADIVAELLRQHARIAELEAQLFATQPAAQGLDAQTIRHISALSELVRMPNAEHFADAHNAAVRHLRAIAAQAKQWERP